MVNRSESAGDAHRDPLVTSGNFHKKNDMDGCGHVSVEPARKPDRKHDFWLINNSWADAGESCRRCKRQVVNAAATPPSLGVADRPSHQGAVTALKNVRDAFCLLQARGDFLVRAACASRI